VIFLETLRRPGDLRDEVDNVTDKLRDLRRQDAAQKPLEDILGDPKTAW